VSAPAHDGNGGAGGAAVRLRGVSRRYGGVTAVDDVTLDVAPGTRHAIIGPNGAGKTTLFKMISRQEPVSEGSIELFDSDITRMRAHRVARLGLARTYQITQVFPELTVIENEMLAAQGLQRSKFRMLRSAMGQRALREKASATLSRVGLDRFVDTKAAELGHGQQRQLELALALVGDPRLLLLDEPAAGLSGSDRGTIRELVRGLPAEITVLLIEHDMELALGLADRVTCLHNGATVCEGTPDEIRADERVQDIYLGRDPA
jgi:branched-chain amino acid transport system ATP-binding protein